MFFKKDTSDFYSRSLSYYTWKRLKRSKLALFGLVVIGISVIIALLGSVIRPDSSPMANEMLLQLTAKEPGFTAQILKIRKNKEIPSVNILDKMFFGGKENDHNEVPINRYWFESEYIVVEQYTGLKGHEGLQTKFHIADVLYPLDYNVKYEDYADNGFLEFHVLGNKKISKPLQDLRDEIEKKNIVSNTYILGTDRFGRDMLSRLMSGTIVSLSVGFISVFISLVIGISLGAIGGFFKGRIDDFIVWLINVVWSIPTLLLVIAITLALGKGFWQVFIAVGLTMWVEVARVVRGQILSLREKEFIEAGRALGFSDSRLIFRHVLPNIMGPVIVISAANFASAILIEAGLSFLGIGAQPPMASWGTMIKDHYGYIITGNAFLALMPGFAIMLMVLAFMLVGNGLRDALDSRSADDYDKTSGPVV
ncbi:MAG: ABC transporter permease [Bacteroidetes bacterium]|nr:ABC transporter permease [Bacteroidota bacterium]HET6243492.1 ABC transporter permease [Bacteroidia bacterium]